MRRLYLKLDYSSLDTYPEFVSRRLLLGCWARSSTQDDGTVSLERFKFRLVHFARREHEASKARERWHSAYGEPMQRRWPT